MSSPFKSVALSSAAVVALSACPALAQSSVGDLFAIMEAEGGTVEFSEEIADGGSTEWRDLVVSAPDGEMTIRTAWLKQTDIGGGAMQITLAPEAELAFFEGEQEMARVALRNEGLVYTIEPVNTGLRHTYSADLLSLERLSGDVLQALDVSLAGLAGFHAFSMGEMIDSEGGLSASNAAIRYDISVPGGISATDYVIEGFDLSFSFAGPMADPDELESFAPYSGHLKMASGPTSGTGSFGEGSERVDLEFSGGNSLADVTLGEGRADYIASAGAFRYLVSMAGLGFPPFEISADSVSMNVGAPIVMSDTADDARVQMSFEGLTVSDGIWAMFDPQASLPRDPMTLIVDIGARMRWLVEPPMAADAPEPPIDVENASINNITIRAAGAEVLASGAADIDVSGPVPTGDGAVNITVKGVIGLTEKLAGLGLMPPDMVTGARGMLGAFANPVGEDHYESEIVLSPNGMITANGIPLPIQ